MGEINRKITLKEAVKVGDNEVKEFVMRRAKVKDRLNAQRTAQKKYGENSTDADCEVALYGCLCGVPFEDLEEMPDEVLEKMRDAYLFLKKNPLQAVAQKKESKNSEEQS